MNKSELVKAVASQTDLPSPVVEQALDGLLEVLTLSMACNENVLISGFGKFEVRNHGASTRRNPRTGETMVVNPTRTCGFRPSAVLKKRLNQE